MISDYASMKDSSYKSRAMSKIEKFNPDLMIPWQCLRIQHCMWKIIRRVDELATKFKTRSKGEMFFLVNA